MERSVAIYALIDPRNGEVGYVGKTVLALGIRRSNHLSDARRKSDRKIHRWINELLANGVAPEIGLVEAVTHDEWDEAERDWIAYFRNIGQAKGNSHCGGQVGGRIPGWKMSDDQKRKISASLKGRIPNEAQLRGLRSRIRQPGGWSDRVDAARARGERQRSERAFRNQESVRLYDKGKSMKEIAVELGCGVATVHRAVSCVGRARRPGPRNVER